MDKAGGFSLPSKDKSDDWAVMALMLLISRAYRCVAYILDHKCLTSKQGRLSAIGDREGTHRIIKFFCSRAIYGPQMESSWDFVV